MMKRTPGVKRIAFILMMAFVTAGCYMGVGERVVGFESGQFFYSDGILKTDYKAPFDKVWAACEKTVSDMKGTGIEKKKKIGTGTIDAVIGDEKVRISVEYVSKNITSAGVRVGMAGNNLASQLIQEKIKSNLLAQ
jgi:Protein of unknown function (DUF3568)